MACAGGAVEKKAAPAAHAQVRAHSRHGLDRCPRGRLLGPVLSAGLGLFEPEAPLVAETGVPSCCGHGPV